MFSRGEGAHRPVRVGAGAQPQPLDTLAVVLDDADRLVRAGFPLTPTPNGAPLVVALSGLGLDGQPESNT